MLPDYGGTCQVRGGDSHFGFDSGQNIIFKVRGGIKKYCFFLVFPKGGRGLAESKISLSEKTKIFLDFFWQEEGKGGGSHLFKKGFIIKY